MMTHDRDRCSMTRDAIQQGGESRVYLCARVIIRQKALDRLNTTRTHKAGFQLVLSAWIDFARGCALLRLVVDSCPVDEVIQCRLCQRSVKDLINAYPFLYSMIEHSRTSSRLSVLTCSLCSSSAPISTISWRVLIRSSHNPLRTSIASLRLGRGATGYFVSGWLK
jgi:hypothetical protein